MFVFILVWEGEKKKKKREEKTGVFPGPGRYCTDPAQPTVAAGEDLQK